MTNKKTRCRDGEKYSCPYMKICKINLGEENGRSISVSSFKSPIEIYGSSQELTPKSRIWHYQSIDGEDLLIVCNPFYMGGESFFS